MSGQMSGFEPWLLLVLVGFLPTEVWRVLAVFAAHRLDEDSEILVFVRAVATALLAGIVAKLLLTPAGALALCRRSGGSPRSASPWRFTSPRAARSRPR